MNTEAIVNTANDHSTVGTGCDSAVYKAAEYNELLKYREEKIWVVIRARKENFVPATEKAYSLSLDLQD